MAELSEKRQKFIQNVASNPNASQAAKNIAAKYAASAGTTTQAVGAQPKAPATTTTGGMTTTTSSGGSRKVTTSSITGGTTGGMTGGIATGGTPKDVAIKTPEQQITTQEIKTPTTTTTMDLTPKAPTTITQQMTFPAGTQGLRASAEKLGLPVGFDAATGQVSIGGKAVDVTGLQRNAQGSYFGTPEQIRSIINQAGTPPTGTQGLREAFAGRDVQYAPETGVVVDGVPVDTSNLPMVGDIFYVTPAQAQALAAQIDQMKSDELKAQDKIKEIQAQQAEDVAALQTQKEEVLTGLKDYKSLINDEFISSIRSVFGNPFEYNPNADKALQQAQIYAERQLMAQLNARGIANSTIARDQYASLLSELIPKYESIAFDRYNQNVDNTLKQANILRQLSQDDYERYKDFVTQSINSIDEVSKNTIQQAKNNIDTINDALVRQETARENAAQQKIDEYNAALKRYDTMGFADNETAALLRVDVNTPSGEIKKLLLQKKLEAENDKKQSDLIIQQKREQTKLDKEEIDYEYNKKLPMEQAKLGLEQAKFAETKRSNKASEALRARSESTAEGNLALRQQEILDKVSGKKKLSYTEIDRTLDDLIGAYKKSNLLQVSDNSWTKLGSVEAKDLSEFIEDYGVGLSTAQKYGLYGKYDIPIPKEKR